jgi:hypothetical protein
MPFRHLQRRVGIVGRRWHLPHLSRCLRQSVVRRLLVGVRQWTPSRRGRPCRLRRPLLIRRRSGVLHRLLLLGMISDIRGMTARGESRSLHGILTR